MRRPTTTFRQRFKLSWTDAYSLRSLNQLRTVQSTISSAAKRPQGIFDVGVDIKNPVHVGDSQHFENYIVGSAYLDFAVSHFHTRVDRCEHANLNTGEKVSSCTIDDDSSASFIDSIKHIQDELGGRCISYDRKGLNDENIFLIWMGSYSHLFFAKTAQDFSQLLATDQWVPTPVAANGAVSTPVQESSWLAA